MNPVVLKVTLVVDIGCYVFYTVWYALKFRKNLVFKGRVYLFHQIMFWIVPFIWIWFVQAILKSTKGSHEIEKKSEPISFGGYEH